MEQLAAKRRGNTEPVPLPITLCQLRQQCQELGVGNRPTGKPTGTPCTAVYASLQVQVVHKNIISIDRQKYFGNPVTLVVNNNTAAM